MDIKSYISSGIIETYVMGLCTPEEKKELESFRQQYPQLNEAILNFETELEKNLVRDATQTGIEMDNQILKALSSLSTPVVDIKINLPKTKKTNWLKPLAAAAILLLALSMVFNYILYRKTRDQQLAIKEKENYSPLPVADYNILKQSTITPVAMYGVAPHSICRCTLFWDKKTRKAFIIIHHLPMVEQNNYQLWAMVDGKPVNVGLINEKIRGRFIEIQNVPAGATGFIVTLEKSGGSSTPTTEETYLSGKI